MSFTGCFWCRDFSSLLRQQIQLNHLPPSKPVIASRQFTCRDITMLSRHHSLNLWLILSCLSGDSCRDLLLISFNYLGVATSELDCESPKTTSMNQPVAFISALPFDCTCTPLIAAFFYCFFFFLPFFLLMTNW